MESSASLESPLAEGALRSALESASDAAAALFHDDDRQAARAHLENAEAHTPGEPMYRLLRGTLLLADQMAAEAAEVLERCADEESSPYRKGLSALMHGRALDVLGHRREARAAYARVPALCGDVDPNLCAQATRASERGFSPHNARSLVADIIFGDVPG